MMKRNQNQLFGQVCEEINTLLHMIPSMYYHISYVCVPGDASPRPRLLLRLSVGTSREDRRYRPICGLRGRDRPGLRSLGRQRAPADWCRQRDALRGPRAGQTHSYTQTHTTNYTSCLQFGVIGNKCGSNLLTNGSNMRGRTGNAEIHFNLTHTVARRVVKWYHCVHPQW